MEWAKIFNSTSDRGLIFKIYKELKKLDIKIPNNPIKKWGAEPNKVSAEESQMAKIQLKNCPIFSVMGKCKSKQL